MIQKTAPIGSLRNNTTECVPMLITPCLHTSVNDAEPRLLFSVKKRARAKPRL